MWKLPAAVAAMILSGAPALAGDDRLHASGAGGVNWSEFESAYRAGGVLGEWDSDRNGVIGQAEYVRGMISRYDADRDGRVGPDEVANGPGLRGNLADYDNDGDGVLSADEIDPGLAGVSGVDDTDDDGILGVHEVIAGTRR